MSDVNLTVNIAEQSQQELAKRIADAMEKGGKAGAHAFSDAFQKSLDDLLKLLQNQFKQQTSQAGQAGAASAGAWSAHWKTAVNNIDDAIRQTILSTQKLLGSATAGMTATINDGLKKLDLYRENTTTPEFMEAVAANPGLARAHGIQAGMHRTQVTQTTAAYQSTQKENVARLKAETQLIVVEANRRAAAEKAAGQKAVIAARAAADQMTADSRIAGEQRLVASKLRARTILNIEKALLAGITGLAKSMTSILSKGASGIATVASKMVSGLGGIFKRGNKDVTDGFGQALSKRERELQGSFTRQEGILSKSLARQREQMRTQTSSGVLGAVTGKGLGMGVAGLLGGAGLAASLKEGYTNAVDLGEQLNKNNVIYGGFGKDVAKWTEGAVDMFGSTQTEALTAMGTFGNLFKSLGENEIGAGYLSGTLVQLAADLSSFNNVPVEDVFDALRSGLVGEQEPLRRFGININEATLKAKALELGMADGKKPLDAHTKAIVAHKLIMEQTTLAQGDFARTMNEGANAQRRAGKAYKEMMTTIMAALVPVVTYVNLAAIKVFNAIAGVIKNDTSPALALLKTALKGVAIALGAVVAMKGAVEVFKLIGTAVKMALGPLGIFLTVVGLVGGAIAIMMDRSENLRETVKMLGKRFQQVFDAIGKLVGPILAGAGSIIDDVIIPAVDKLAQWLADHLLPAFDAVAGFIKDNVLPVLETVGKYISSKIGPVFQWISGLATSVFNTVVSAITNFGRAVLPLIQPAIDAFRNFGVILGNVFRGKQDFSSLWGGLKGIGTGLWDSIKNIAGKVGELLAPVGRAIADWFKSTFTGDNMKKWAMAALDFIEMVGYWIGKIVTHPTTIKAIAAIAAVGVAIAGKLLLGFAKGVIDNLPALMAMLQKGLSIALGALFKLIANNLGTVFMVALGAVLIGGRLIGLFKKLFSDTGATASKSFMGSFKQNMLAKKDFLTAAFGGADSAMQAAGRRAGKTFWKAQVKEQQSLQNELRAMGSTTKVTMSATGFENAREELKRLQNEMSAAQIAGLKFRDKMSQYMNLGRAVKLGVSDVGRTLGTMGKQFGKAILTIGSHTRALKASDLFKAQTYKDLGAIGGQTWAGGFRSTLRSQVSSIGSAFKFVWSSIKDTAAATGVSAGKLIAAGVKGAASGAMAAYGGYQAGKATGESGGNGMATAAITGLTAGLATGNPVIGVAAAGMSLLGTAIGQADARAKKFKESVKNLTSALESELNKAIETGKLALGEFTNGLLDFGDIADTTAIAQQFFDDLGNDGLKFIDQFGLKWEKDFLPLFTISDNIAEVKTAMSNMFIDTVAASDDFATRFGAASDDIAQAIKDVVGPGGPASTYDAVLTAYSEHLAETLDIDYEAAVAGAAMYLETNKGFIESILDTEGDVRRALDTAKTSLDDLNLKGRVFGTALDANKPNTQIDSVKGRIEALKGIIQETDLALQNMFGNVGGVDVAQATGIVSARSLGQEMQSIFQTGGITADAEKILNVDAITNTLATAVNDAISTGELQPDQATAFVQPIIDSYLSGITDPGLKEQMRLQLTTALGNLPAQVEIKVNALQQQAQFEAIQTYLDQNPFAASVAPTTAGIAATAQLTETELQTYLKDNPTAAELSFDDQIALAAGKKLGYQTASGIPAGIQAGTPAAKIHMGILADLMIAEYKRKLGIASPSRVMAKLGVNVVEGLAVGIGDATPSAAKAATSMVQTTVNAAVAAANAGQATVNSAMQSLFGGMTGTDRRLSSGATAGGLSGAMGAVTSAFTNLGTAFEGVRKQAEEAAKASPGSRTFAQTDIIGEAVTSLSAKDVLGVANLSAFTAAFDAISKLGEEMLATGMPVADVTAEMAKYRDQLIDMSWWFGFNTDQVKALADSLGLSSEALQDFINQANASQGVGNAARTSVITGPAPYMTQTPSGGGVTNYNEFNVMLPTGNPQAAALAIANRQASLLW